MKLSSNIQKAINLASRLHFGQVRKGDLNLPFISHPFAVAWILSNYTDDEDVVIAGLLHDSLEDVPDYYFQDLVRDCGEKVARLVKGVSEDKNPNIEEDGASTWLERKQKYLNTLEEDSDEALLICAADKIHNLQSMMDAYQEKGEALWDVFHAPKEKKLWLYEEVVKLLKERLDNPIVAELEKVYQEAEKILLKKD